MTQIRFVLPWRQLRVKTAELNLRAAGHIKQG